MKTNLTIETASASFIAEYLDHLYSITEDYAANEYSTLWYDLWNKIMTEGIYDIIMKRFDDFDWESAEDEDGYDSYKEECYDFISNFIDYAASKNENLLPSFDDYVKYHN